MREDQRKSKAEGIILSRLYYCLETTSTGLKGNMERLQGVQYIASQGYQLSKKNNHPLELPPRDTSKLNGFHRKSIKDPPLSPRKQLFLKIILGTYETVLFDSVQENLIRKTLYNAFQWVVLLLNTMPPPPCKKSTFSSFMIYKNLE